MKLNFLKTSFIYLFIFPFVLTPRLFEDFRFFSRENEFLYLLLILFLLFPACFYLHKKVDKFILNRMPENFLPIFMSAFNTLSLILIALITNNEYMQIFMKLGIIWSICLMHTLLLLKSRETP